MIYLSVCFHSEFVLNKIHNRITLDDLSWLVRSGKLTAVYNSYRIAEPD